MGFKPKPGKDKSGMRTRLTLQWNDEDWAYIQEVARDHNLRPFQLIKQMVNHCLSEIRQKGKQLKVIDRIAKNRKYGEV